MLRWSLGILALCVACGSIDKAPSLTVDQSGVQFATISPGETSEEASIRIANTGRAATGALITGLAGQDPDAFIFASDGCRATALAPGGSCEIRLAFRPSSERQFSAELTVSAGTVAARVAIAGTAEPGAQLSLRGSYSFGGVELGQSATTFVTVSNVGRRPSRPLSLAASGDTSSFSIGGDCVDHALTPTASCSLEVTFIPRNLGAKTLSLNLSASPSSVARATFDGYGKRLAIVTVSADGPGQVGMAGSAGSCAAAPCRIAIEIGGPVQNLSLIATPGAKAVFANWAGDCSGTTPTCNLAVDADRSVIARFAPAVSITFEATTAAAGWGTITLEPGAWCSAPCRLSALVPRGSRIRLSASPDGLSQVRWMAGCSGAVVGCEVSAMTDLSATALFNGANYVFVSSRTYPTNLGIAAYDDACNQSARAAGLPGPYVAWLSTSRASAASRVGSARGFIRVDGRPFADTLSPGAAIYYPIALDETGKPAARYSYPRYAMTGSDELGQLSAGNNCSDWTVAGVYGMRLGDPLGGAGFFSGSSWTSCQGNWLLYCIGTGIQRQRPLQREKSRGRLAFVSSNQLASGGGLQAADSLCADEARAAGLPGSFKALLAADGASAASRFNLGGWPWIRVDGVAIVDTAADLGRGELLAPIDVSASGAYDFGGVWAWLGATHAGEPGTADSTCASWTSAATNAFGRYGQPTSINPDLGLGAFYASCDWRYRLYCLQE